jgi:tripartite-type tricarboxylate transporter receptor subunit TctC
MRVLGIFVFICLSTWANAQTYPSKPIRLIVGYPPGGSGDFTTRIIGDELSKDLGVAVVVENKPGAGGSIASEFVAKSAPDGYIILNQGNHQINKSLYKNLGYDEKDFVPVSRVANGATVLVVNNDTPFKNLRELIAYAKANPGKLFNASAGFGSAPHIAACAFEAAAGIKVTSVQYKGGGPAALALLSGDTQMMFATSPTVMGFVRGGRMRPLVISMRKASPAIQGIPGADDAGLPGYESTFWFGLYVPAGTPVEIVRRLHAAAAKGLAKPEVREKIASQGMDAAPSASPSAFDAEIRTEAPEIERALRDCGAKIE